MSRGFKNRHDLDNLSEKWGIDFTMQDERKAGRFEKETSIFPMQLKKEVILKIKLKKTLLRLKLKETDSKYEIEMETMNTKWQVLKYS